MTMMRHALLLLALLPLAACKDKAPAAVNADPAAATAQATKAASAEIRNAQRRLRPMSKLPPRPPPRPRRWKAPILSAFPMASRLIPRPARSRSWNFSAMSARSAQRAAPTVSAMKAKPPPTVHFVEVPAAFGGPWDNYASASMPQKLMGLHDKTHDAMFRAIHVDQTLKGERGMDTPEDIAAFYKNYGADPGQFLSSMQSFAVAAKINRARQYMTAAFANGDQMGTPTFLIDGKYRQRQDH